MKSPNRPMPVAAGISSRAMLLASLALLALIAVAAIDIARVSGPDPDHHVAGPAASGSSGSQTPQSPLAATTPLPDLPPASASSTSPTSPTSAMPTPTASTPTPTPARTHHAPPSTRQSPALAANTLAIPSQGVTSPVDTCSIVAGGLLPPADVHRTCIWAGGAPLEAAAGTTVIAGEPNSRAQGAAALGAVSVLRPGDRLLTAGPDGSVTRWAVFAVTARPKSQGVDPAAFAGRDGARRLYLVSAGGPYDRPHHNYLDNVYVQARPI